MRRAVIAAVLSAGVIAVGAAPASAAGTRAEYAQQADPICKSSDKDTGRLWRRFVRQAKQYPFKIQAAANALERIGTRLSSSNTSLRLIAPPPGDETRVSQWLDIWDRIAANYPLAASAYRRNDYRRLNHILASGNALNRQARSLMLDFPFASCA